MPASSSSAARRPWWPSSLGQRLERYVGVDIHPPDPSAELVFVHHDLADGLGPVGDEPFDIYFASFGVASHLSPAGLERLCGEIAAHARPGSLVALEALGLFSVEWPSLWDTEPGEDRTIAYRLAGDTLVHPWAPSELRELFENAGIEPVRARRPQRPGRSQGRRDPLLARPAAGASGHERPR